MGAPDFFRCHVFWSAWMIGVSTSRYSICGSEPGAKFVDTREVNFVIGPVWLSFCFRLRSEDPTP